MKTAAMMAVAVALAGLSPLGAQPAAATPVYPDQVVKSYAGLPKGWTFEFIPHTGAGENAYGHFRHVTTDVPLDVGALRLSAGPGSSVRLHMPLDRGSLHALVLQFGSMKSPQAPGWLRLYARVDGRSYRTPVPPDVVSFEATTAPMTPTRGQGASTTLEALLRDHQRVGQVTLVMSNKSPTDGAFVDLDWWVLNQTPKSRIIDFEGRHTALRCTGRTDTHIIEAGEDVRHTAMLSTADSGAVVGSDVALWSLPNGHRISRPIAHRTTGDRGRTAATTQPLRMTRYFWQHEQDPRYTRCRTPVSRVLVRRSLAADAPGRIRVDAPWRVSGTIFPLAAGCTVDLWQRTDEGNRLVATTDVAADGTFTFNRRVDGVGRQTFMVKGAGGFGNLPGRSSDISVWVR